MPTDVSGLLATFQSPGAAARAIRELRGTGVQGIRAAMPAPYHEVEAALGNPPSQIGWWTLGGAIVGLASGYALTCWTSADWPLVIGGKPIVSPIPYTVIAFECMVLIGALVNLVAVLTSAFVGRRRARMPQRPAFSQNRIGVFVPCASGTAEGSCEMILRREGAEEVERAEA